MCGWRWVLSQNAPTPMRRLSRYLKWKAAKPGFQIVQPPWLKSKSFCGENRLPRLQWLLNRRHWFCPAKRELSAYLNLN